MKPTIYEACITCTRRLEWDAAHRVMKHESKCSTLHGHRYRAEITCRAKRMDGVDRVVDFGEIKTRVGGWIDKNWDHTTILNSEDSWLVQALQEEHETDGKRAPYVLYGCEPTAEMLTNHLFWEAARLMDGAGIEVVHVRIYETPNCWADFDWERRKNET